VSLLDQFEHRYVPTDDGQRLAVHIGGEGPPLLFATGIGVRHEGLEPLAEGLCRKYRVIFWDYRTMGESYYDGRVPDMSVERHARDGFAVLDALRVESAPVIGWSMGVPVGFEMIRAARERVTSFAALFGSAGDPFSAGFPRPVARGMEAFFQLLRARPVISNTGLGLAAALPNTAFKLLSAFHFVGHNAPKEAFARQVAGVAGTPKEPYFEALLEMSRHSAWDLLPHLELPVLIIGGAKDWLTPPRTARKMAAAIPGARLHIFDRTTHFGIVEEAPELVRLLTEFVG
jgi:pimeloyl-ACP methyl ester carboxylesterase